MPTDKLLSIIIPIYNEARIAADYLPQIFKLPINKEVIIVNDGSSDNTAIILESLHDKYSFRLIHQEKNQGKGAAVNRGLQDANGDYFIICDADAEYEPNDINILFHYALTTNQKNLVIYGSRFLNKPSLHFYYLVNRFLTELTNLLFSTKLTDMETCFKLIPLSALKQIKLNDSRFEIEPEITAQLIKNSYQITELPINYRRRNYRQGKKIRARDGFLAIKTLIREKYSR